ncbi:MAG: hypothetical protein ACE5H4_13875 [Candidatus Thorarchaeota archaeon]
MRRILVTMAVALIVILSAVPVTDISRHPMVSTEQGAAFPDVSAQIALAGGTGDDAQAVAYLSRLVDGQFVSILNSYLDTATHSTLIDLSSFQESGWTLYRAVVDAINITAAPEREVVGDYSAATFSNFYAIYEYDIDLYYNQLAQGFYNMSHDGQLQNFSILYDSPSYDPGNQNYAYLEVRENYTDSSAKLTTGVQVADVGTTATWMSVAQSASLSANRVHYVVINGSLLQESALVYPTIRWHYESGNGPYKTWRHTTDGNSWGSDRPFEALVNYTYIPWNQTSGSALEYSDSTHIDMRLNGTQTSGFSFAAALTNGITALKLSTNQSADMHYNLTLWYKQDATSSTNWDVPTSGGTVYWNATTITTYPAMAGTVNRFLNVTVPLDWKVTGLYNSSGPSNHTDYTRSGRNITCASMSDQTWTLTFEGYNYVTDIDTFDSSDDSVLLNRSSFLVLMDINSTVQDQSATGIDNGSTNLTIVHEGSTVYAPSLGGVAGGQSHYLWNVTSANDNGTFLIQLFWTNGTEAGFLTKQMTVFYPTTLTSITPTTIYANTDSFFGVTVQFELWNSTGIVSPDAVLTYSYRSIVNDSLNDMGSGTWNITVNTGGEASGTDTLTVYATGPAIQNKSIDIIVTLTHQTSLEIDWQNPTFEWTESAIFRVNYTHDRDGSLIADADQLDVVVDGNPTFLHGSNGTYWIEFNNTFDLGFHTVVVNISKLGYDPASNNTLSFRIDPTTTDGLSVTWDPLNVTIHYDQALNLTVDYTYGSGIDVPASAVVNVTIGGRSYGLTYTGSDWIASIRGWSLDPGVYGASIEAWAYGFVAQTNVTGSITVTISPNPLSGSTSWTNETVLYGLAKLLQVDVTYSNGTYTTDAIVSATVLGATYNATSFGNGTYEISIGPVMEVNVHDFNLTITRTGYMVELVGLRLNVTAVPSTVTVGLSFSMYWDDVLTFNVTFHDATNGTPIVPDTINIIGWPGLDAVLLGLNSTLTIDSTNLNVGSYEINITVHRIGYQDNVTQLTIEVLPVSISLQFLDLFEEYENETVWISATVEDDFHLSAVNWAGVVLEFEGSNYTMPFNSITSTYRVGLWLNSSYLPGNYTFTVYASASNCNSTLKVGNLRVLAKVHIVLMLVDLDTDIIGNVIPVTVNASRGGSPVEGLTITVYARFNVSDGTPLVVSKVDVTDANGVAEVNIDVPASATGAEVWAEYAGSRQEWPASTRVEFVSVTPQNILGILLFLMQQPLVIFLLGVVVVAVGTRSVWKSRLQPRRFAARTALEKQLDSFKELETVQHFMAVYTDRGTCVFYHPFRDARIQPDLISGFIAAITSVYGEIKGNGVQGSLEEINYQGLRLNSYSGRYIIGIVIVEQEMSSRLRDRLQFFVELFEDQYDSDLDGWTGLVDCFDPEWVVSNLNTAFTYNWMLPHHVDTKVKVKGAEAKIVKLIQAKYDDDEFLIKDIIADVAKKLKRTEAEAFDTILHLEDMGAIYPISTHTVLQRQGFGIADEEAELVYEMPFEPEPEIPEPAVEPEVMPEVPPEPEPVTPVVEEVPEPIVDVTPPVEEVEIVKEPEPVKDEAVEFISEVESLMVADKKKKDLTAEELFIREVEEFLSKQKKKKKKGSD